MSGMPHRLAEILGALDELEKSRLVLLARVESLRQKLLAAGDRTTTMRASVDLLSDHIDDLSASQAEASALELELPEIQKSIEEAIAEAAGLTFESESLHETLNETDQDLERLASIFVERPGKRSRGH
jgi:regulator of replication initiation timing